jgi:hypothetical protein
MALTVVVGIHRSFNGFIADLDLQLQDKMSLYRHLLSLHDVKQETICIILYGC